MTPNDPLVPLMGLGFGIIGLVAMTLSLVGIAKASNAYVRLISLPWLMYGFGQITIGLICLGYEPSGSWAMVGALSSPATVGMSLGLLIFVTRTFWSGGAMSRDELLVRMIDYTVLATIGAIALSALVSQSGLEATLAITVGGAATWLALMTARNASMEQEHATPADSY